MYKLDDNLLDILHDEEYRQDNFIILSADENFVSSSILKLQGSVFNNTQLKGYPNKKYTDIPKLEKLAIDYACQLFSCRYANVLPSTIDTANQAVLRTLIAKGDTIMSLNISSGGSLTHGYHLNFSGRDYHVVSYSVDQRTELLDYDEIMRKAKIEKPRLIIAGADTYSRVIDFEKFREIADAVGAYLLVDISSIVGLVAAGIYPSPLNYADVVTSSTQGTLRGPKGGIILSNDIALAQRIDQAVDPGLEDTPLVHSIAAKAQCLKEALQKEYKDYARSTIKNAHALCASLIEEGLRIISGGTDNHQMLVDTLSSVHLKGSEAETLLASIGITVDRCLIPFDREEPHITSGIRLGTQAMTTRGFTEDDFKEVGHLIAEALKSPKEADYRDELRNRVLDKTKNL